MKRMAYHLLAILILGMAASAVKAQILLTASATPIEEYAAVELQRYYYQLSGRLLSIDHEEVRTGNGIVLTRLDHPLVKSWRDKGVLPLKSMPGEQGYVIRTVKEKGRELVVIAGVDANGLLYGVYGLLEDHLGMRFYMNGDVYPDRKEVQTRIPLIQD